MKISLSKNFDEWEDFLRKENGNIFQSPIMIPAYSKALKFNVYLLTVQLDQAIVGGMLIYRRSPKLPLHLINELYTPYGPIIAKEDTESIKNKIIWMLLKSVRNLVNIGTVKHTFFVRADSITSPPYTNWHIFEKVGYRKVPYGYGQTFVINLEPDLQSILKNFEKRTRWSLNKAKKFNIKAQIENSQEGLKTFYKLYMSTAKRHGSIITPFNFLNELYRILVPKKMMDIYIAYFDNIPVSAAITLDYKDTAYYYMAASLKKFHYTQANTFLQFFIISKLKDKGIKRYDLLCAPQSHDTNNPQYGLYLFKRGFGGKSVPVFHYEQIYSKMLYAIECRFLHIYKKLFF
jgi:lipid II:glycine glycyltransferase (peptidoglycan interpeptide bridge formation enzyme)